VKAGGRSFKRRSCMFKNPLLNVKFQISNTKYQIPNKSQIPISNDQNIIEVLSITGLEFLILVIEICLIFVI
jgi:hypothetical protein